MEQMHYTNSSSLAACDAVVLAVPGKIRLFKATFVPTAANSHGDFMAAECDFTGYPTGGISTTAPEPSILYGPGVSSASYGTYTFVSTTPFTVSNVVGGYWIETAGGGMVGYVHFATPVNVGGLGSGFVVAPVQVVGEVAS